MSLPFIDRPTSAFARIRVFHPDAECEEFTWHRDPDDRWVTVIEGQSWLLQLENKLPQTISERTFIPAQTWHRLIKGTGQLVIKIENQDDAVH